MVATVNIIGEHLTLFIYIGYLQKNIRKRKYAERFRTNRLTFIKA